MNRQARVKINRKVAFLLSRVGQNIVVIHPSTTYFLSLFWLKPKINELDTVVTANTVLRPRHPQNLDVHLYNMIPYHTIQNNTLPYFTIPCNTIPYHKAMGKAEKISRDTTRIQYHAIRYHTIQ